ncbi:MAG: dihydroxy-acid dehydratase [Methanobrevibacter sp.]|nr:dihydroxy-acid dehydratase [Methanobrevibacter sp.]
MRSDKIKKGIERSPHRSLLRACGLKDEDFKKPFIGIANSYTDIVPGHIHLQEIANAVKEGINQSNGVPFEFNTMAICDGIAMNHEGMKYSLPSREIIANTVESVAMAHSLDGLVLVSSCDKIVPGMLMGAARLNIPSIMVTGGPMLPGEFDGKIVDFVNVYEAVSEVSSGKMTKEDLSRLEKSACPGPGSCSGLFTANTMACITESLGMSLPMCATTHAVHESKLEIATDSGKQIMKMIEEDLTPSKIMTQKSFENALAVDMALGGSSNTALHIPAIASELEKFGVKVDLDLFDKISREIPHIASISPAGNHTMLDLHNAGGIPGVLIAIQEKIATDTITSSGKTLKENIQDAKINNFDVIRTIDSPVHSEGGIAILKGNLAPNGSVIKQAAVSEDMMYHKGPVTVFNSEEEAVEYIFSKEISEGDIIVIRYEGPKGGPGMREMLNPTSAIVGLKIKNVALITDGRFSGGTRGPCVGHISPEAQSGGPIAGLQDGDIVEIDIKNRAINVELDDEELKNRLANVDLPKNDLKGWLNIYQKCVSSADKGAILR